MYQTRTCTDDCAIESQCVRSSLCGSTCDCTPWSNGACGGGSCSPTQRLQTRTCPNDCDTETRCITDSSCLGSGTHTECQRYPGTTHRMCQACVVVPGSGPDECSSNDDCCNNLDKCQSVTNAAYRDYYWNPRAIWDACNPKDEGRGRCAYTASCDIIRCNASCETDSDCDDGDPNTLDTCDNDCSGSGVPCTCTCSHTVICTPYYYNDCDSTDGCGKTRDTSPYNSCDLTSDTTCETETKCDDGIDNDCDGLIDCVQGIEDPDCNCPENCTDNIDNDGDLAIDGRDADCEEGQGIIGSTNRGCDDGIDNDGDTLIDLDDPGCCDLALSNPDYGFDDTLGESSGIGTSCGGLTFKWELGNLDMPNYCCGNDDPTENFISTTIGSNTYYACCDQPTDCVDANGDCQIGIEETFDLCLDGKDNDCDGQIDIQDTNCTATLEGYIYNEKGVPIGGATVTGSPPGLGPPYETTSPPTTPDGHYTLNPVVGTYNFIARKEGYDDNITTTTITTGTTQQLNFTLRNGSCHEDCTDYYGNCNPACNGTTFAGGENCTFINPLCYNRPKGFTARYINKTTNTITEYVCCEGPKRTYPVMKAKVTGNTKDLYDYVINIKLGGRRVKMHILTWYNQTG